MTSLFGLTAAGIQIPTQPQVLAYLVSQAQAIYGADINVGSDTPDGQLLGIIAQMIVDNAEYQAQQYASFDPDQAFGITLDQRLAMNGIQRQGGTYSVTPVTVVTTQSVNLYGLDQTVQPVFTVADNAGNQWQLMETSTGLSVGTSTLNFQAASPGAVLTVPNTITVPVTIVLGVQSVNNPSVQTTLGINEETDAAVKVRRQQSVALSSQGYQASLLAALQNVSGVTSAFVYENVTGSTNGDGVPGHSIWCIVAGSGAAAAIAQAIYTKRNAGCGMFGSSSYTITRPDGSPFVINYDVVTAINLFIAFTVTSINGTQLPNIAAIQAGLAANYAPGVNQEVNINQLATLVQEYDANTLVTNAGLTSAQTQVITLSGVAASGTFKVKYNGNLTAAINWNDSAATIQTKVRAVTGLSAATVTGSIASQSLSVAIPGSVAALFLVTSNSLATSGSVAITATLGYGYANILPTPSKANQFAVTAPNIVILPMQLNPATSTVTHALTEQLTGLGGYGALSYGITTNNSGGSINAATGVYTAGTTPNVTDIVTVTDVFGNTATATINVI